MEDKLRLIAEKCVYLMNDEKTHFEKNLGILDCLECGLNYYAKVINLINFVTSLVTSKERNTKKNAFWIVFIIKIIDMLQHTRNLDLDFLLNDELLLTYWMELKEFSEKKYGENEINKEI